MLAVEALSAEFLLMRHPNSARDVDVSEGEDVHSGALGTRHVGVSEVLGVHVLQVVQVGKLFEPLLVIIALVALGYGVLRVELLVEVNGLPCLFVGRTKRLSALGSFFFL